MAGGTIVLFVRGREGRNGTEGRTLMMRRRPPNGAKSGIIRSSLGGWDGTRAEIGLRQWNGPSSCKKKAVLGVESSLPFPFGGWFGGGKALWTGKIGCFGLKVS
jgi:hypothetical protein